MASFGGVTTINVATLCVRFQRRIQWRPEVHLRYTWRFGFATLIGFTTS
jgi:hypothetical protein